MEMYKGREIVEVTEEHLKVYGSVMFSFYDKPAEFAKDVDDAKRKIDMEDEIEERYRYSDNQARDFCQNWDRDEIRHYGKSNWDW